MNDGLDIYVGVVEQSQFDGGPFTFYGTLDEVIASLQAIRDSIPEEYRSSAKCDIDSESGYGDSHHAAIEVFYYRPETAEEKAAREDADRKRLADITAKERAMLAALLTKYPNATP